MKPAPFFYKHAGLGSLLATATNAFAIFLVFRTAYHNLGGAIVGIWAIIQSIMVISRLGDSGSGGNITRLVAIDRNKHGGVRLRNFILAGLLVGTLPIAVLGLMIFVPIFYYMSANYGHAISAISLVGLITCSLAFGLFNSVALILSGCLDGLGLMSLRGCLSSIANILCVVFGYIFIDAMGVIGLGLTYVTYAIFWTAILVLGIGLFVPAAPDSRTPPVRELIRRSVTFNVHFIFISLLKLLLDPVCKLAIGRLSTLEVVAIFDLANKFAGQTIVLFSSVLQSLLPSASRETKKIEHAKHAEALEWMRVTVRCAFCAMTLLVLLSRYLSQFTLGHISVPYMLMQTVLAFGGAINTLGLVGYYLEVGSGHLKRLVAIFAGCAVLNLLLSILLGLSLGALGVGMAYSAAWIFGGLACAQSLFRNPLGLGNFLLSSLSVELPLFLLSGAVVFYALPEMGSTSVWAQLSVLIPSGLVIIGIFLYRGGAQFLGRHFGVSFASFGALLTGHSPRR